MSIKIKDNDTEAKRMILHNLKKNYSERLQRKTGWGRIEVLKEFDEALIDTLNEARALTEFVPEIKNILLTVNERRIIR